MRAFMSSQDARLDAFLEYEDLRRLAKREARAILAETEPDGPQTALFGIERVAARNCAPSVWTDTIAATLRALDEAPNPESWLAFLQRNPTVELAAFVEG